MIIISSLQLHLSYDLIKATYFLVYCILHKALQLRPNFHVKHLANEQTKNQNNFWVMIWLRSCTFTTACTNATDHKKYHSENPDNAIIVQSWRIVRIVRIVNNKSKSCHTRSSLKTNHPMFTSWNRIWSLLFIVYTYPGPRCHCLAHQIAPTLKENSRGDHGMK